jgi:hypothetical protein
MVDTFDNLSYQLDDLLSAGFSTCDQYETYQMLKVQYEDGTGDYSYSIRELTGQLDSLMSNRENNFPELDEQLREDYLELISQLKQFENGNATYYLKQLGGERYA